MNTKFSNGKLALLSMTKMPCDSSALRTLNIHIPELHAGSSSRSFLCPIIDTGDRGFLCQTRNHGYDCSCIKNCEVNEAEVIRRD